MEYRKPKKGDIYQHFKGNLYEVVAIAMHTETEESMVVYKEVGGEKIYARPYEMFVSKVDKEKYPDVSQEYRFEFQKDDSDISIMDFLDIRTVTEKIRYLELNRNHINGEFIEIAAHCLDFVEKGGTIEERYRDLLQYLKTVEKYERRR